jgi:hypothetical protein
MSRADNYRKLGARIKAGAAVTEAIAAQGAEDLADSVAYAFRPLPGSNIGPFHPETKHVATGGGGVQIVPARSYLAFAL